MSEYRLRLKRFIIILLFVGMQTNHLLAQDYQNGLFSRSDDVGACGIKGSSEFKPESQSYLLSGSGANIWASEDQFHFAWDTLDGDFIIQAKVSFIGEGAQEHRKIGLMLRESLSPSSPVACATVHGDGLCALQYRTSEGEEMEETRSGVSHADMIQLERKGKRFIFSAAVFGNEFDTVSIETTALGGKLLAGIFICSHDNTVLEKAEFSNIRIYRTVKDDYIPYNDYLGSNLEVLDLETGLRKVLYQSTGSIQAPNWTPDNKYLIFNGDGLLYRYELATGDVSILPTGSAKNNNNDHVLSFDGKQLGISNHLEDEDFKSIIFTLPAEGGEPVRVTKLGPSYLHGWSPDSKYLTYTAERKGEFDIYKIDVKGKKEIRLTNAPGLDDGSEYSPDGKFIYFNSSRTGTMQLWRMKPDGSEQEQLTFDDWNDWFPHISPDGKDIVFLSFPIEVPAGDHPFYKRVMLRKMPTDGGEPVVVAYLYGGQGTINVPSWSPDGRKIAFISNSDMEE